MIMPAIEGTWLVEEAMAPDDFSIDWSRPNSNAAPIGRDAGERNTLRSTFLGQHRSNIATSRHLDHYYTCRLLLHSNHQQRDNTS